MVQLVGLPAVTRKGVGSSPTATAKFSGAVRLSTQGPVGWCSFLVGPPGCIEGRTPHRERTDKFVIRELRMGTRRQGTPTTLNLSRQNQLGLPQTEISSTGCGLDPLKGYADSSRHSRVRGGTTAPRFLYPIGGMAYALVLETRAFGIGGSSPSSGTKFLIVLSLMPNEGDTRDQHDHQFCVADGIGRRRGLKPLGLRVCEFESRATHQICKRVHP